MKKVSVSIVVPVYNVEKYLARCLESLINQTLDNIEIICVNNGSTDNSLQILKKYAEKDKRIQIINLQNSGLSVARNAGIDASRGEFIGFVDSDDWVDNNFNEKLYNIASINNCDIAVAGIIRQNKQKSVYDLHFKNFQVTETLQQKFKLSDVPDYSYVWNKIYNAQKLKFYNIKFPVGKYYEDQYFTPQALLKLGKLITVTDVFYHYWRHTDSIVKTTKINKQLQQDALEAFKYMDNFIARYNIDTSHCTRVKKYRILGLTLMKSITKSNKKTNILLNCIKWNAA